MIRSSYYKISSGGIVIGIHLIDSESIDLAES
jgi:hypothetical protein